MVFDQKTDFEGLSQEEARKRLQESGWNEIPGKKRISALSIFYRQFRSLIIWVLVGAVVISLFLGETTDAAVIAAIVVMNALLGFVQEYHAEKSLSALRRLSAPLSKVIRGGSLQTVPSREIVPGDLLFMEQGDHVPADARLIRAFSLQTQEAALTGESLPVSKQVESSSNVSELSATASRVFMGTSVVYGKGYAEVTGTGKNTELGRIASLLETPREDGTPLEKKLDELGRRLVFLFVAVVGLVFIMGVLRGTEVLDMFMVSLSLAVAAIPEGLPAVVTIALAFGVKRMAKRHALLRRLASVETLGCATVICTDKTGTLTRNEMTVRTVWAGGCLTEVTGTGYDPAGELIRRGEHRDGSGKPFETAVKIGLLCNGAKLSFEKGVWQIAGDPTEAALLVLGEKSGLEKGALERENPLLEELPFDSDRKRMSILRKTGDGAILFVKGAPDVLMELSDKILMPDGEKVLDESARAEIAAKNSDFAAQALRVLAVAYRRAPVDTAMHPSMEQNLVFAGLIAMMDSPRPEAKRAIEVCKTAGIRTVMMTGDHRDTAAAIGLELGLLNDRNEVLNGADLESMDPSAVREAARRVSVYARVSAEHKYRIVRALRDAGEIVAMTGDGVNDAPAVREADIGVAMGLTGTDVTKEASDMVITDDNFASIVNAVEEGRGIYDNILKFVSYLISHNLAEVFVLFFPIALGLKDESGNLWVSLSAVQILWMNLVTDGFPALALSLDPLDPQAMKRHPRSPSEKILSLPLLVQITVIGLCLSICTLALCLTGTSSGMNHSRSLALTALIFFQFIPIQILRSRYHLSFFSNSWLLAALVFSCLIQVTALYWPPLQQILGTVPLAGGDWLRMVLWGLTAWACASVFVHVVTAVTVRKTGRV